MVGGIGGGDHEGAAVTVGGGIGGADESLDKAGAASRAAVLKSLALKTAAAKNPSSHKTTQAVKTRRQKILKGVVGAN